MRIKLTTEQLKTLKKDIQVFKEQEWPDKNLIRRILETLGIYDIVELEFTLKKLDQRERNAAMKMIERHLEDLLSGDEARWADAKDTLNQIYYTVPEMDEEAFL